MKKICTRHAIVGLLVLAALAWPMLISNDYMLHLTILGFIWAIAVYGMNLILGYTGQLSLAHAGFFGIGAYTAGLLTVKAGMNFWLALIAAVLITAVIGFLIGIISLRTKGHYFSIFTLCVGVIINLAIDRWDTLTEGVRGLMGIPVPHPVGPVSFNSLTSQYYLALGFLLLTIIICYRIINSMVGRSFIAIHNSEDLAETVGIDVMKTKLLSFALSAVFASISGALYAGYIRFLGPDISSVAITFDMLLYLLVGGIGTISGPLVGVLAVSLLTENLQQFQEYRMVIFGPLLIILIMFFPRGIAGSLTALWHKFNGRYFNVLGKSEDRVLVMETMSESETLKEAR